MGAENIGRAGLLVCLGLTLAVSCKKAPPAGPPTEAASTEAPASGPDRPPAKPPAASGELTVERPPVAFRQVRVLGLDPPAKQSEEPLIDEEEKELEEDELEEEDDASPKERTISALEAEIGAHARQPELRRVVPAKAKPAPGLRPSSDARRTASLVDLREKKPPVIAQKASPSVTFVRSFSLDPPRIRAARVRARFAREKRWVPNRYGTLRLTYAPANAQVSIVGVRYRERIGDFITRYVRGGIDKRARVDERELRRFALRGPTALPADDAQEVEIINLPLTQRTNPGDPTACSTDAEDYCTFVYRVTITHPGHAPRTLVLSSPFALGAPGAGNDGSAGALFSEYGQGWAASWSPLPLVPNP